MHVRARARRASAKKKPAAIPRRRRRFVFASCVDKTSRLASTWADYCSVVVVAALLPHAVSNVMLRPGGRVVTGGVGRRHPGGCKPTPLRTRRHLRRSPSVSRDRVGLNESNDRRVPFRLAGMTSVLDPSLVGALFYGRLARNGARDDSRLQLVARAIRF